MPSLKCLPALFLIATTAIADHAGKAPAGPRADAPTSPEGFTFDIVEVKAGAKMKTRRGEREITATEAANMNEESPVTQRLLESFLSDPKLKQKGLSRYFFTRQIRIDPLDIPHSSPVLTLNTAYNADPDQLLSTFLHEQIHWFVSEKKRRDSTDAAIADLRKIPDLASIPIPWGLKDLPPERARFLTDNHIMVNWLELQAAKRFLGNERAYQMLGNSPVYADIYPRVIRHEEAIRRIMERHDLVIEP